MYRILFCFPIFAMALLMVACSPIKSASENIDAGYMQMSNQNYKKAESYFLLAESEIAFARGDETKFPSCLHGLSLAYLHQSRHPEAEAAAFKSLEFCQKKYGADSVDVARSQSELGDLYVQEQESAKALDMYEHAQAILDKLPEPDHALAFYNLSTLAKYYAGKNGPKAATLYKRALDSAQKSPLVDGQSKSAVMERAALVLTKLGKTGEAEELYKQVIALCDKKEKLGPSLSSDTLLKLAEIYRRDPKKAALAEPLYQRVLKIEEKSHGEDSLEAADCLDRLAFFYISQDRYADAESQFKRALRIRETVGRRDAPRLIEELDNYSTLLKKMNKLSEAKFLDLRRKGLKDIEPKSR